MNPLQIKAVVPGILFGLWPLLMARSGLDGYGQAAVFAGSTYLGVLPFFIIRINAGWASSVSIIITAAASFLLLLKIVSTAYTDLKMPWAYAAGVSAGMGLLLFTEVLAKSTRETIGSLFVIMVLAQICIPAIYQLTAPGNFKMSKIIALIIAVIVSYYLGKP